MVMRQLEFDHYTVHRVPLKLSAGQQAGWHKYEPHQGQEIGPDDMPLTMYLVDLN
jgi:hypothetical protein